MAKKSGNALIVNSNNSASKRLERTKRQAILLSIVEADKSNMSFEEIASRMRDDPWVSARFPAYSAATARRDYNEAFRLVEDDIRRLGKHYLAHHLDLMDDAITTLSDFGRNDNLDHKVRIDAYRAMLQYLDQANKVFGSYAAQRMDIRKAELSMDLDTFMALRERAQLQLGDDDTIVDGELVDSEKK